MDKDRLEAFSDGVLAIIITIMILELKAPVSASWQSLVNLWPTVLGYTLSYAYIAIYWTNHYKLVKQAQKISWKINWANISWLFFTSFIPFTTAWVTQTNFQPIPTLMYIFVFWITAIAYHLLMMAILPSTGLGDSFKRVFLRDKRAVWSLSFYTVGLVTALFWPILTYIIIAVIAVYWIWPSHGVNG